MDQITEYAVKGWNGVEPCDAYRSSNCWLAYQAGKALREVAYACPMKASISRGYSVKVKAQGLNLLLVFDAKTLAAPEGIIIL